MLMELRYGNIDRPLHPVQEEGLAPEARRRGPRGRDHGQDRAQSGMGRHERGKHAAAPRGEPLAIISSTQAIKYSVFRKPPTADRYLSVSTTEATQGTI